jgi:hypothetical protein
MVAVFDLDGGRPRVAFFADVPSIAVVSWQPPSPKHGCALMSNDSSNVVQTISWRELFPWTLITRSLAPAVSIPVILLATAAVILNAIGWRASEALFLRESVREANPAVAALAETLRSPWNGIFDSGRGEVVLPVVGSQFPGPYIPFRRIIDPFLYLFKPSGGLLQFCFVLLGSLLTVAIWAFFGTAIARIALLRYTRSESPPLAEAVRYAAREYVSAAACIMVPLIGVAILSLPAFVLGLLMAFNVGFLIISVFYVVVLALAIVMAIILLGLTFGWPLSISAIAGEGQGFFDALTRSFADTFNRPQQFCKNRRWPIF